MSTKGLYFSVSGIGTARASALFQALKAYLNERLPDRTITFLDTPFKGLLHPLAWNDQERRRDASSRLMSCWALLNEHVMKHLRPALERGDIVVTHRFGLDCLLYATAIEACADENEEAARVHHALVRIRIIEQKIKPPMYLIPNMVDLDKIREDWVRQSPALKDVRIADLRRFVEYERSVLDRYFDPKHGQNPPYFIDASFNSGQMLDRACHYIRGVIEQQQTLAA